MSGVSTSARRRFVTRVDPALVNRYPTPLWVWEDKTGRGGKGDGHRSYKKSGLINVKSLTPHSPKTLTKVREIPLP